MNQEQIKKDFLTWMVNFVETPNPLLGNWAPCPYARTARVNNTIELLFADVAELEYKVELALPILETKDAFAMFFDHEKITPLQLESRISAFNKTLMPRDYVILEDHPDNVEHVNGVHMNFGACGLLLVQKLSQLNTASTKLKEKGYYKVWSEEKLDWVVNWRSNEILQDKPVTD